ncbi:DUF7261 family protein [Halorubrum salinarum]|uniref:DUF7261 family protein n=1 Tax=Halorubrum salinarum TaxID=2739057 RepID=UPI001F34BBF6|nr:hypothetical protein [Halorubrum salinarum]
MADVRTRSGGDRSDATTGATTESGASAGRTPPDRADWGRRGRDVRESPDEDRGQIILITGLTLAVLFVAVVLLLNTVIYTENLATRGVDAGGAEAVEFRDGSVEDLAGILYREHRNGSANATAPFLASAERYGRTVGGLRARDGVVADVRVNASTVDSGHFIAQNETDAGFRNMTAPDGTTADWTVAGGVNRTRNYRLTVDSTSVATSAGAAFTVVADGAGGNWSVSLSNDAADAIDVTVRNETDTVSETFLHDSGENVTIDLTAGTVDGQRFPALVWAEGVQNGSEPYDSYDVRYENGTEARGTYHLVVDERDGTSPLTDSSRPYVVEGIYSVEVEVLHRTPGLTYGDTVRLAPGERDA